MPMRHCSRTGGSGVRGREQAGDVVTTPRYSKPFNLPSHAITLERYQELMEGRTRPLTGTDPIHKRTVDDGTQSDGLTPYERVIAESRTGEHE